MANSSGDPGVPGSGQWDEYFDSFTRQMQNVKDEIKEAVDQVFEDDMGERARTARDMITDDGILINISSSGAVEQHQGAGDASVLNELPGSSKSEKRAADMNSDSDQSPKRRKVKTDGSDPDEAESKLPADNIPEDSVAQDAVQDAAVPQDDHVSDEDFADGFFSDASLAVTDSTLSSVADSESVPSLGSDRESIASVRSDQESVVSPESDRESVASYVSDRESVASYVSDRESVASSVSDRESVASVRSDQESVASSVSDRESVASSVSDRESFASASEWESVAYSVSDVTDPSISDLGPTDSSSDPTADSSSTYSSSDTSQESDNEGDEHDNEWSWEIGNNNYEQKSVYSSDGTVCHSGHTTVNGNFISWTGYQLAGMRSFNGTRFVLSNTGNSGFYRVTTEDSVIVEMDGIMVTVRPKDGIRLDGIEISLSNEGVLTIEIPE